MEIAADLRLGTPGDTRMIAEYMLLAGGGLFEQLLEDIVPGTAAEPLLALALAINQPDSPFTCENAILAEIDGRSCGLALCFPSDDYRLPDTVTAFVPLARLARVEVLIQSCLSRSFYIHSLAVAQDALRRGVAKRLLHAVAELATAQELGTVSLHVWHGNAPAMALYDALGFEEQCTVVVPHSPRLHWDGPVALLAADTAMLLTRMEAAASGNSNEIVAEEDQPAWPPLDGGVEP